MFPTHLVLLLLCCSGINSSLEEDSIFISPVPDHPGHKDIEQVPNGVEFNIHALDDFQLNCNIYKIKMKKFSYGCKKCICKDNVLDCLNDDQSCEAEGTCHGAHKNSWVQDDGQNCTCINGTAVCKTQMVVDKSQIHEDDQDTPIVGGIIPFKFTYEKSLFVLEWRNPRRKAQKYSFHMSTTEKGAKEISRVKQVTSSRQVFDATQQVCSLGFTAEVTEAELNRTYTIGNWTKMGVQVTPCDDEIYHIVFMAHINDKCPKWNPNKYCIVPEQHCNSDSECPDDQVCCIISYCGPGCTKPRPHSIWKAFSSQVKMLNLTSNPQEQPFFLDDDSFNAAGAARLCLVSHMLTLLSIVLLCVNTRFQ